MYDSYSNEGKKIKISFDFGGIGLITFIVFLILKLTGVIGWKWIFVFLPLIIPVGVLILGLVIVGIICLIIAIGDKVNENRMKRNKKE